MHSSRMCTARYSIITGAVKTWTRSTISLLLLNKSRQPDDITFTYAFTITRRLKSIQKHLSYLPDMIVILG